jgi:hypothetical protein
MQSLALSMLFVGIAGLTDGVYVVLAGALAPALSASTALVARARYLQAGVYLGLGLLAALADARPLSNSQAAR